MNEKLTNIVKNQEDLAQVVADNLFEGPQLLSAGGPEYIPVQKLQQMKREKTKGKILNLPSLVTGPGLLFLKFVDENVQAKLDYFNYGSPTISPLIAVQSY